MFIDFCYSKPLPVMFFVHQKHRCSISADLPARRSWGERFVRKSPSEHLSNGSWWLFWSTEIFLVTIYIHIFICHIILTKHSMGTNEDFFLNVKTWVSHDINSDVFKLQSLLQNGYTPSHCSDGAATRSGNLVYKCVRWTHLGRWSRKIGVLLLKMKALALEEYDFHWMSGWKRQERQGVEKWRFGKDSWRESC